MAKHANGTPSNLEADANNALIAFRPANPGGMHCLLNNPTKWDDLEEELDGFGHEIVLVLALARLPKALA